MNNMMRCTVYLTSSHRTRLHWSYFFRGACTWFCENLTALYHMRAGLRPVFLRLCGGGAAARCLPLHVRHPHQAGTSRGTVDQLFSLSLPFSPMSILLMYFLFRILTPPIFYSHTHIHTHSHTHTHTHTQSLSLSLARALCSLLPKIRNFAKQLEPWLRQALAGLPEPLVAAKLAALGAFVQV